MSDLATLQPRLVTLLAERRSIALCTVVQTRGSSPRKAGARMIIHADGSIEGTIGGGTVEEEVRKVARRVLHRGAAELVTFQLTADLAMCCGGEMTFFVEPVMSAPELIVFGCGHVGSAVVRTAQPLGFTLTAVDDLPANTRAELLPQATRVVNSYEADDLGTLPFGADTYVVIATREHALDQRLLELCIRQPFRYLGVIGSERKASLQRERLRARGVPEDLIGRVRCPMGVDIGAQTPEEIAVSICAELVATRRAAAASEPGPAPR